MDIITQTAYHRQRMLKYCKNNGVTKTSYRYKVSRKTIYKWLRRYDNSVESLKDRSRRPHTNPKAHTESEIALIKKALKKVKHKDLILAYQRLLAKGYSRSYGSFKRISKKLSSTKQSKPKLKKALKPYQRAEYPGQKVQIDVKYVPSKCVVTGDKYYQFTAKDECTRWTYRQMYEDKSSYSAHKFLIELIKNIPFPIKRIQTDNGTEFTNTLLVTKSKHKTLFEQTLDKCGIEYQRIRIATPRHNGKVERQHRTDGLRFYDTLKMYSLDDGRNKLSKYQKQSNNIIMTCLGMRTPNQVLNSYLAVM